MMLADMGAEVIRVDRAENVAGGDPATPPADLNNRGRRSIGVDLKNPDGVAVVLDLVERADALVEAFARGRGAARHRARRVPGPQPQAGVRPDDGLGPGRSPGGGGGPRHQLHRPGGRARSHRAAQETPVPPLNLIGDYGGGGMLLAFGVVCGVLEGCSGRGQVVDTRWSTAPPCSRP